MEQGVLPSFRGTIIGAVVLGAIIMAGIVLLAGFSLL